MTRGAAAAIVALAVVLPLASCAAPAPPSFSTTFEQGVLAAEPDSGSAADLRAVRSAAVGALTDAQQAFDVDPALRGRTPDDVLTTVLGPAATRAREALLERARSAKLATDLQDSFTFYAKEEFGSAWTGSGTRGAWLDRDVRASSRFHVDRWQGVRIEDDVARVLVRGESRGTTWGGTSSRSLWAQYQLILHRDADAPHGWRLVRQQAATTAA